MYFGKLLICVLIVAGCNNTGHNNIDGLWVIGSENDCPKYLEFIVHDDSIYFHFPEVIYHNALKVENDSILLFGENVSFVIEENRIVFDYYINPESLIKLDFVRPSFQQLEIGVIARRWIYKVEKSDLSDRDI